MNVILARLDRIRPVTAPLSQDHDMSPLHQAIENLDKCSVVELLDKGADPNQTDSDFGGFRPLHLAIDIECEDACRRYDSGAPYAQPHALLTELLLQAGADPNLPDEQGRTAWEIARKRNHQEALSLFSMSKS